jgi:hypothetical protein
MRIRLLKTGDIYLQLLLGIQKGRSVRGVFLRRRRNNRRGGSVMREDTSLPAH